MIAANASLQALLVANEDCHVPALDFRSVQSCKVHRHKAAAKLSGTKLLQVNSHKHLRHFAVLPRLLITNTATYAKVEDSQGATHRIYL